MMKISKNMKNPIVDSFLGLCDPRAKLLAFFLLMPLFLTQPLNSPGGWVVLLAVFGAFFGASISCLHFLQQLKRLRWFFVALFVFHAFFTPGQPIIAGFSAISREGAMAGGIYTVRLILMVSLSWVLLRTTSHGQIVAGMRGLFGFLEKVGVPLDRWLSLLAFTLGRIPHLLHEATSVREDLLHRLGDKQKNRWFERIYRMALAGEALLFRLLRSANKQEEALLVKGIATGLLPVPTLTNTFGWRDGIVLAFVGLAVIVGF